MSAAQRLILGCVCALSALAGAARGQCAQLVPGDGYPGVVGPNLSRLPVDVSGLTAWDPDGAGPETPRLVVSGEFSYANSAIVYAAAALDPATGAWTALPGFVQAPRLVAATPAGDLFALHQGSFVHWTGTNWAFVAAGLANGLETFAALANGNLIAAGDFTSIDSVSASSIALWDGTVWSPLGLGIAGVAHSLVVLANGDIIVGGDFVSAGGGAVSNIARWDGSSWSSLGAGIDGPVFALAVLPNGDVVAGGDFTTAGGTPVSNVARWNGTSWSPMAIGADGDVRLLAVLPNGEVIAAGDFTTIDGVPASRTARFDGAAWFPLGTGPTCAVQALSVLPNGDVVVGCHGGFGGAELAGEWNGQRALELWDGTNWRPLGPGLDEEVRALARLPNGDIVAGGDFLRAGAVAAPFVALWDGALWSPLAAGVDGAVRALVTMPNGDLIAGGNFTNAGGAAADHVARWDGVSWSPLGLGVGGSVRALAVLPNGDLVAGGDFTTADGAAASHIARWDGVSWSALGAGVDASVFALAVMPNGDLIAGGLFTAAGGASASHIARWDGVSWSALVAGVDAAVFALTVMPNGDLIVGGCFVTAGGVPAHHLARWDGLAWSSLGATWTLLGFGVRALAVLPNGQLIATDYNLGGWGSGQPHSRLQTWDGTAWSAFGTTNGGVQALSASPGGELALGGAFTTVDGTVSAFFARYVCTCMPTAVATGVGCSSSGGTNTLVATTLPWADTTFRATGTGLPTNAFVVALTSVTPIPQGVQPLSGLFAEGQPGCDVLVTPDLLQAIVTTTGTAESTLFLPNVPPLAGIVFHHQMIPFELDAGGALLAITATNALQLVGGDF